MSRFEKVSFEQWKKDCGINGADEATLREMYDGIKLPHQATAASAGCDFYMPFGLDFVAGSKFRIATGVRWVCAGASEANAAIDGGAAGEDRDRVLLVVPRSGLGFKYGIKLSNTIGVIDADYCDADNEGHIIISLENPSDVDVKLEEGKPFAQGIVVKYEIPEGAAGDAKRAGGFGSTDKK